MNAERRARALIVLYTFSEQAGRVADAMAAELEAIGCEVTKAPIEFTDARYRERFSAVPMERSILRIVGMLPAQLRRATGEIGIPEAAGRGDYDLVLFSSPTWWLTTNMPIRSYLESPEAKAALDGKPFAAASVSRRYWKGNIKGIRRLGEGNGGSWLGETHFLAAGGQVKSMLSWLAYMRHGEARERVLGLSMPAPNLQPDFEAQARGFVRGVAERALGWTRVEPTA